MPSALALRIERNALRSLTRIDDFVALARARSQPLNAEELDLLDLLFDAVAEAWQAGEERGVRLKVVEPPDEAVLQADRSLLRSAIARLLRHALRSRNAWLAAAVRGARTARRRGASRSTKRRMAMLRKPLSEPRRRPRPTLSTAGPWWSWWRNAWAATPGNGDEPAQGVRLRVTLPRA